MHNSTAKTTFHISTGLIKLECTPLNTALIIIYNTMNGVVNLLWVEEAFISPGGATLPPCPHPDSQVTAHKMRFLNEREDAQEHMHPFNEGNRMS